MKHAADSTSESADSTLSTKPDGSTLGTLRLTGSNKTLVICPIGLGNFLMAVPAIKLLSESIGNENIHLLALKGIIRDLGQATGYFSKIHTWDPDKEPKSIGVKRVFEMRREKYDYTISLFPSGNWRFALLNGLIGAKERIGFQYPNDSLPKLVQTTTIPLDMSAHDTDQNSSLIEKLVGCTVEYERQIDFPYVPDHPNMDDIKKESYFVCHPGSSAERGMKEKRLPTAAFAKVIRNIHDEFGLKCVLIGGPEEQDMRDEIKAGAQDVVLDYKSRSLAELAALIDRSKFYIGNDSGLMHVSVALGKRCIVFFGPTDEKRTGPYSNSLREGYNPHLIVRRNDLSCSPCWTIRTVGKNIPCIYNDTRCLRQFEVDSASQEISSFIRELMKS